MTHDECVHGTNSKLRVTPLINLFTKKRFENAAVCLTTESGFNLHTPNSHLVQC